MKQLTKKQAIALAESGEWKDWTDEEIVKFQLFQNFLCMDWSRFCQAVEAVLGRGVYTHEYAKPELLQEEYLGNRPTPTFEEIISQIPADKLIVILDID